MKFLLIIIVVLLLSSLAAEILIPMDITQTDHLKAYGVAYNALQEQITVQWLLNFRGGSYLIPDSYAIESICNVRGVSYEIIGASEVAAIFMEIEASNMDAVMLEKEPKIVIYVPPNRQPWDDAVTLALTYAEIDYDTMWDDGVLTGKLDEYDWLLKMITIIQL